MAEFTTEHDVVFRLRTARIPGTLGRALSAAAESGAHIGEIVTVAVTREYNVRDVTVIAPSSADVTVIRRAMEGVDGVDLVDEVDKVFAVHRGGKLRIEVVPEVRNVQDLREVYTPGVARVAKAIADDPTLADDYTWRGRTVAVVSNGTRVLGLGNVGPAAALPVMEGKALFYRDLVGLNAVPIVVDTADPDELIETVVRISPGFGAIHLEDIASPAVYRVEDELDRRLDIPVMHDDQHGTAVVVLAAVLSAARLVGRPPEQLVFGQVGLGSAGSAIARLALGFPFDRVIATDPDPEAARRLQDRALLNGTRPEVLSGEGLLASVMGEADVVVLTTGRPGLLAADLIRPGQIVLALSNPAPEITLADAEGSGAAIAADGSIVNNILAYPGLFRGSLDARARTITQAMKRAAVNAITDLAPADDLLPDALDVEVHESVAARVRQAASG